MASAPPPGDSPPSPPSSNSPPPSSPPPPSSSTPPNSSPPSPTPPPPPPPPPSLPPPPSSSASPSPPPPNQNSLPPTNSKSSPPSSSGRNSSRAPPPNNDNDNGDTFSPPPPPSHSHSKHSPPHRSISPGSKSSSQDGGGLDSTIFIIIGVAAGVAVVLLFALVACLCTRKKKKREDYGYYYRDPSQRNSDNYYNSSAPANNWQNGNQFKSDKMSNLPPPPGAYGSWVSPSPPPPPGTQPPSGQMTSGEWSSNYSGPYGPALPPPHPSVALGFTQSSFTYEELAVATAGFSQANLLGQGGFGYVHKGVLPNGKDIAVKSLKAGSGQGDREFQAEVEIISRVHHRHLVSLVGYCIAGGQKLLVYEFVSNSTLEFHLHGKGRPVMDWPTRIKIALGSAKGLAYLHEDCHPRIIHRDIKAANILLDHNFEAKVADFGLAKLSSDTNTHVSTRIMGTFGYLAPEYALSGKLTEKSDVFSFGVMLLELITGRRPVDLDSDMEDSLVDWASPLCEEVVETGNFKELVDPRLEGNFDSSEMLRMVTCAGASVRQSARKRPKMSQIVRALEGDGSMEHLEGLKLGQSAKLGSSGSLSSDYDNSRYSEDMKKFRKVAMDSQDYASNEYGQTS